jgi:hypothetical protein
VKKSIVLILTGLFLFSTLFPASGSIRKDDPSLNGLKKLVRQENTNIINSNYKGAKSEFTPSRNLTVVFDDAFSLNGYGLVSGATRPIDGRDGKWVIAYRKGADLFGNGSSGVLGVSTTNDITSSDSWETVSDVNTLLGGIGAARYPNAAASADYPYAIWNEYTADVSSGSLYGGRGYYNYDQLGWGGNSWGTPVDVDLLWQTGPKDHWVGSAQYSWSDDLNMGVMNVTYDDWTRFNHYLFHIA